MDYSDSLWLEIIKQISGWLYTMCLPYRHFSKMTVTTLQIILRWYFNTGRPDCHCHNQLLLSPSSELDTFVTTCTTIIFFYSDTAPIFSSNTDKIKFKPPLILCFLDTAICVDRMLSDHSMLETQHFSISACKRKSEIVQIVPTIHLECYSC
jgi:hypothetical protein